MTTEKPLVEYKRELWSVIQDQIIDLFEAGTGLSYKDDVQPEVGSMIESEAWFELNRNMLEKIPDDNKIYSSFILMMSFILMAEGTDAMHVAIKLFEPIINRFCSDIQKQELEEKFGKRQDLN